MSLEPPPIRRVLERTACIAEAAFRGEKPSPELRDELGSIFRGKDFPTSSPSSAISS